MFETVRSTTKCLLAGASVFAAAFFAGPSFADDDARPVKVMIINMFGGTCVCRKLNPGISVMQSAQDRATKNAPGAIDGARDRCIFL